MKLFWVMATILAVVGVGSVLPAFSQQPLGFDEGWNLQAPYELAENGRYASFGAVFDGQTKIFDPYLSTGPAVSFPITAVFKVFGTGVEQARVVMLLFFVAALFLLAWYVYGRTKSLFALLAPAALFLVSSSGINFRMEALGEMAAVAYALGALIAWQKERYALAGLLAACAMLSKFLMPLLVAAGFAYFVLWLVKRWSARKTILKAGLKWTIGVGVPLVLWECFRFVQLGGSLAAYKHNLREYFDVIKANGSGIGSTGTDGLTIPHKFSMLLDNVSVPNILMILLGLVLVSGLIIGRHKLSRAVLANGFGLLFIALYSFWWFIMSDGGYVRYTLPLFLISWAVILQIFLTVTAGHSFRPRWVGRIPRFALAFLLSLAIYHMHVVQYKPLPAISLDEQKRVAQIVKETGAMHLNHVGWWQNPEVLFLTKMHSIEMNYVPAGERYNLLLGPALREIVPTDFEKAETLCQQTIFKTSDYLLCGGTKPVQ